MHFNPAPTLLAVFMHISVQIARASAVQAPATQGTQTLRFRREHTMRQDDTGMKAFKQTVQHIPALSTPKQPPLPSHLSSASFMWPLSSRRA